MQNITEMFGNLPLLAKFADLPAPCQAAPLYLVGGALREALLGRPIADLDFTASHDLTACAQGLARLYNGHWFWLDPERRQSRVLIGAMTCDFAPWRAPTLAGDLALRDYTVNALALDLAGPLTNAALIDPLDGTGDLERRRLRCAGPGVLQDDPLRILKGLRHVAELDLVIEPATLAAMQAAAPGLMRVAPERLRSEIWQLLAAPEASRGLDGLLTSTAGALLFGPAFNAALPFAQMALERTRQLFSALIDSCPPVKRWLAEPVEQRLDRATLLTFSAVLHAVDAALPLRLASSWRFGRATTARLAALDNIRTVLWMELGRLPQRPRTVALWALQYSSDPIDLLLGLGLQVDLPPHETARQLAPVLLLLSESAGLHQVPHLVDGRWLAEELGLSGEMLGVALASLRRAEIYGRVATAEDARCYLRREFGAEAAGKKD